MHEKCVELCFVDKRSVCWFSPPRGSHPARPTAAGLVLHVVCIKALKSCE